MGHPVYISPVSHRILDIPLHPVIDPYLDVLQQIHCIPLYPTASSCIRTYLAVSSCICRIPLYLTVSNRVKPGYDQNTLQVRAFPPFPRRQRTTHRSTMPARRPHPDHHREDAIISRAHQHQSPPHPPPHTPGRDTTPLPHTHKHTHHPARQPTYTPEIGLMG